MPGSWDQLSVCMGQHVSSKQSDLGQCTLLAKTVLGLSYNTTIIVLSCFPGYTIGDLVLSAIMLLRYGV